MGNQKQKMTHLYTLTPNPALDLSGHVKSLIPNEKNTVFAIRKDPGGNGINAAKIAHRLGRLPVVALGFLGGPVGRQVASLIEKEGVRSKMVNIHDETRINVTATNDRDHLQTRLTFPGPKIRTSEKQKLLRTIRSIRPPALLLLGGSLPEGLGDSFYREVAQGAHSRGIGVIADVPARWFEQFKPRGKKHTPLLFIKPNDAELSEWTGKKLKTDSEILKAARELLDLTGRPGVAVLVVVSLGARGAFILCGNQVWFLKAPKIRAQGTVGAGDSFVGAFAMRLAEAGLSTPEALRHAWEAEPQQVLECARWAVAAGAATAAQQGTAMAQLGDVRKLLPKVATFFLL